MSRIFNKSFYIAIKLYPESNFCITVLIPVNSTKISYKLNTGLILTKLYKFKLKFTNISSILLIPYISLLLIHHENHLCTTNNRTDLY